MPVLLLYLLLITPVRLTLTLDGSLTVDMRLWGLGGQWRQKASRASGEHAALPSRLARACFRSRSARRFLRRHVYLVRLQVLLRLGLENAAHTALLTGLAQQLVCFLPHRADVRVQPDFLSSTSLRARCILFFHLGTILITAGLLLLSRLTEHRNHPAAKEA